MVTIRPNKTTLILLTALLLTALALLTSQQVTFAAPNAQANSCVIPASGPWPSCATGGTQTPSNNNSNSCVIPTSGPWPACATSGSATNSGSSGGSGSSNCVVPTSGPWPPCATGGNASNNNSGGGTGSSGCTIPTSGPWPPCAAGGNDTSPFKISSFSAWVSPRRNGNDVVTINWSTIGAVKVQVFIGFNSQFSEKYDVELNGTTEISYANDLIADGSVGVIACNRYSQCVYEDVDVKFTCNNPAYFFSTSTIRTGTCPEAGPREHRMVFQQFERGFVLWIDQHHSGNGAEDIPYVYVFRNSGTYYWEEDTWTSADPISDPSLTIPAGRLQPTHGIGKKWREGDFWLRGQIGWATQPEQPYTGKIQKIAHFSMVGSNTYYLSLPNTNQIIELCAPQRSNHCNTWERLTP